jgi:HEAT repeat protein
MGGSSDPRVTDLLVRTLEDGLFRVKVVDLAKHLKDPAALARFLEVARGGKDDRTRSAAILACAELGGAGVYEAAAELLRAAPPGSTLASSAAGALGRLGTVDAARALVDMLRRPENAANPAALVESLARVRTPEGVEELARLARDEGVDPELRRKVIDALGRGGQPGAVPDLLAAMRDSESPEIRSAAMEALGRIGEPAGVQEILNRLHGGDDGVKLAAARALEGVRARAAAPLLEEALGGPMDDTLRASLVNALGNIGSASSTKPLTAIATDDRQSEAVRGAAAQALGRLGTREVVPALAGMYEQTKDTQRRLRTTIAQSLSATAEKEDLPRIQALQEMTKPGTPEHAILEGAVRRLTNPPKDAVSIRGTALGPAPPPIPPGPGSDPK